MPPSTEPPTPHSFLSLPRELLQHRVVDRHTRDSGHGLAAATLDFAPDLDAIAVGLALLELRVTRLAQVAVGAEYTTLASRFMAQTVPARR